MPLTPDQEAEIAESRATSRVTRRAVSDGAESHLYLAHPCLTTGSSA